MKRPDSPGAQARAVLRADAAMAAVILLLGSFLALTGSNLVQRWQSASARQQSVSFEDHLGLAANLAGLAIILWWAGAVAVAFTAALLERGGRTRAALAAGRFSPGFMRRLALAAVGLQLVTAQLAGAAPPSAPPGTGASGETAVSVAWVPVPDISPEASRDPADTVPPPAPAGVPVENPQWRPLRPVAEPGPLVSGQLRPQEPTAFRSELTVRAGDSLWSLSAAQLGPFASDADIAAAWPRLYQANRHLIGADPDLLLPGQILRIPPHT